MKNILILAIFLILVLWFGCKTKTGRTESNSGSGGAGSIALSIDKPPAKIVQLVATISRPEFPTKSIKLFITDSLQEATGNFQNIRSGLWHLEVDGLDSNNIARCSGYADVQAADGEVTRTDITLIPNQGNIDIHVKW
ncbi:MAG: hypothetical protein ACHQQQ_00485 [Bacteroidota bacterium]